MLWPKKKTYMEFDNKKKFLRLENSPPPITFLMVRPLLAPDRSHFWNWLFIYYSFVTHWLGCHNSLTWRISGCKGQQGGKNWCRVFTECVYYFNTYAFCNIIWKGFLLELGFKLHAERLIPSEVIEYFCLWKFFSGTDKFFLKIMK